MGSTVGVDGRGKSRPHLMTGFRNVKYICCGLLQWLSQLVLPSYYMDPGTVPGESMWDLGGQSGPGRDFTSLFLSGSLHHCSILSHLFSCHRLLYDLAIDFFLLNNMSNKLLLQGFFAKRCSFSARKLNIIYNDQPWTRTALFRVITQRVVVISYGYSLGKITRKSAFLSYFVAQA